MAQLSIFGDEFNDKRDHLLLTIQLQYWQLVVDGIKHYEYRRVFRKNAVNAFIYAPLPAGRFVGFIKFGDPIYDSIEEICRIAEEETPGSAPGMREYMAGLSMAYAIPIISWEALPQVTFSQVRKLFPDFQPPQSYLILEKRPDLLKFLQSLRMRGFNEARDF